MHPKTELIENCDDARPSWVATPGKDLVQVFTTELAGLRKLRHPPMNLCDVSQRQKEQLIAFGERRAEICGGQSLIFQILRKEFLKRHRQWRLSFSGSLSSTLVLVGCWHLDSS